MCRKSAATSNVFRSITQKKLIHHRALNFLNFGVLECWSTGVLEYWSIGVLEYWSIGILAEI